MPLKLMYITNNLDVALIAEKYGVDRIWIDLETLGKEERQKNMNTVKSKHSINDISKIKTHLSRAEMLVRVNPWNENSPEEINAVINAGADIIMLPMWKTELEVRNFISAVNQRAKTSLLLETKEAVECLNSILEIQGFDEMHIGLNDLHLSYGLSFMFELLTNGTVEYICEKIKKKEITYGFGGIARLGEGDISAEKIILEHYRLGSTRAILSRSFCDTDLFSNLSNIDNVFKDNMEKLRKFENEVALTANDSVLKENLIDVRKSVDNIVSKKRINHIMLFSNVKRTS